MVYLVIAPKERRKKRLKKGRTMNYLTEFDETFEFWAGALSNVNAVTEAFGSDGVSKLCEFVADYFDDYGVSPTAEDINDFGWHDVSCFETCHGFPQCGCELIFTLDSDETWSELSDDVEMGYARQVF